MEIILSSASVAPWAGKSLLDASVPQLGDPIVLRPTAADATVAGIRGLTPDRLVTILNRGPNSVTLAANDPAAPPPFQFSAAKTIPAGKKASLFVTGSGLTPISGGGVPPIPPTVENVMGVPFGAVTVLTIPNFPVTTAKLLLVCCGQRGSFTPTSITFLGSPLASIVVPPSPFATGALLDLWALQNPPVGTGALVVTLGGAPFVAEVIAVGVNGAGSPLAGVKFSGSNVALSQNVPSVEGGLTFDFATFYNQTTGGDPLGGQTELSAVVNASHKTSASSKPSTGSMTTMGRTLYAVNLAAVGVTVPPA